MTKEQLVAEPAVKSPNPKKAYGDLKIPLALVPTSSIIYEALALTQGAEKYGPFNWRDNPVEAMTYAHAALRHLYSWIDGQDVDPDSGMPTLGHVKASIGILIDASVIGNLIDNRPPACPTTKLLESFSKPAVAIATVFGPAEVYAASAPRVWPPGALTAPREWWKT